jgi:uncharacterized protein
VIDHTLALVYGHYYTVAPVATMMLGALPASRGRRWRVELADPDRGAVRLSGVLDPAPRSESDTVLVAVHGLGGDVDSHYMRRAALAAADAGHASLLLNLRGADMSGDDYYHAGLTTDLRAALASPELARYGKILLLGYSLGGHIVLRYATEDLDPRVRAVAAVCPPLDLAQAVRDIDHRARWPYRRYVLASLKRMLVAMDRRGARLPLPLADALAIDRLRRWDEDLVVPRFGFRGAEDYYRQASVAERLTALAVPSLLVAARHDPMVLASPLESVLAAPSPALDVRWIARGGHVGFPAAASLGEAAPLGLERQLVAWLQRQ